MDNDSFAVDDPYMLVTDTFCAAWAARATNVADRTRSRSARRSRSCTEPAPEAACATVCAMPTDADKNFGHAMK
jgi:hypothetical protein